MPKTRTRAAIDTLYPVAQEGDAFHTVPAPFSAELARRMKELSTQDLGPA